MSVALPTYDDVVAAAARIAGHAHRTPVLTSRTSDAELGARLFFKCENLQRMGAFKFRGAFNALSRFDERQRRGGVVAFSSGNHAQAVALAGQLLDTPRVIVMPRDAPAVKRAATEAYGAEIVLYDRAHDDREAIGRRLSEERGLVLIPPYDHALVVAGQGTAALELFDEVGPLDVLLVPCGGGGLLAGSALSAEARSPACRVIGVEPSAGDDATRSFQTKQLQHVNNPQTVADGARTASMSEMTFRLMLQHVAGMVTVDDRALLHAMFYLWQRLKLLVEPTGALGAAAAFEKRVSAPDGRVGVVLTGGNVDFSQVGEWVQGLAEASPRA
jgi:threonine dehydratase